MSAKNTIVSRIKNGKKPELQVTDIIKLLKENNGVVAMQILTRSIDHKSRIKYVAEKFENSKFRAYSAGMKKFKEAVDVFLKEGTKESIKGYLVDLDKERTSSEHVVSPYVLAQSGFDQMRKFIVTDMRDNNSDQSYLALLFLIDMEARNKTTGEISRDIENARIQGTAADLVAIKWPGNNAIKVLFG